MLFTYATRRKRIEKTDEEIDKNKRKWRMGSSKEEEKKGDKSVWGGERKIVRDKREEDKKELEMAKRFEKREGVRRRVSACS